MSDGGKGKYFSEAHRFESQVNFLLKHLAVPNSLVSTRTFAGSVLMSCFNGLYHHYRESLKARRATMSKETWLMVGRPTLAKLRSDLRRSTAEIPKAMKKNVWRP